MPEITIVQQGETARVRCRVADGEDLLPELVRMELELGHQQVRAIELQIEGTSPPPLDRLSRLGYDEHAPGIFIKTLSNRRAVRFSITEKCNYQCFFCHEEGLEMERTRQDAEEARVMGLFEQMRALGFNEITFTGGEPLLKWRQILRYLEELRRIGYLPDIKFVSNGRVLSEAFLTRLREYPGRVRFNISMHSLDPATHHRIVHPGAADGSGRSNELARIEASLRALRAAGFPFKLNFVLLKGLNTAPGDLERILDHALEVGAERVKFLELLITEKLKVHYPYFYRLEAVRDQLGGHLTQPRPGQRRTIYRWRDTPLEVELQRCTCSHGCNVCALNRDANITAELRHFPCFLDPDDGTDLNTIPLAAALPKGADKIAAMARHYGDHSPLIIRDRYLTDRETFYYYEIAEADITAWLQSLQGRAGLTLERHRQFDEQYFGDGTPAFADFEYVHKLARNTYDRHAMAILQQHRVDPDGSGRIVTTFERDGEAIPSIETYTEAMARKGFVVILHAYWSIDYYRMRGPDGGLETISLGTVPGRKSALLRSSRALPDAPCPLRPLLRPVPAWLAGNPAA